LKSKIVQLQEDPRHTLPFPDLGLYLRCPHEFCVNTQSSFHSSKKRL
jgi:hypothetical protein